MGAPLPLSKSANRLIFFGEVDKLVFIKNDALGGFQRSLPDHIILATINLILNELLLIAPSDR